jgi:high-affinity Fe2+/Pb2+ permease
MLLPFGILRRPTEQEGRVIFWVIFLVLVGFGAVCLFYGYRAPAEKAEEAARLIRGGYGFIAAGVVMLVIRRFFSGFSY